MLTVLLILRLNENIAYAKHKVLRRSGRIKPGHTIFCSFFYLGTCHETRLILERASVRSWPGYTN